MSPNEFARPQAFGMRYFYTHDLPAQIRSPLSFAFQFPTYANKAYPTGNFYSITNESDGRDARIFFAQGCEIQAGAVDESTMA